MKKCPVRVCIAIQIFMSVFMVYVLRATISVNLLAMVKEGKGDSKKPESECVTHKEPVGNDTQNATKAPLPDYGPRYDWSRTEQGTALGAYFWGYLIMCFPGGYVADKFGATRISFLATLIGSVLTALIPLCAMVHVWLVIIARFIIGFTAGVSYPAVQSLISRWAPPAEKGKFVAAMMGNALGSAMIMPLLGIMVQSIGWVLAYIIPACVTAVWAVIWLFTVADSPAEHKWCSEEEQTYIRESLAANVKRVTKLPPYLKIFSNLAFWALVILHFGNMWGLNFLMTNGPMYMKEALGFDIKNSGALAALPYLGRLIMGMMFGSIGDVIKKKELLSVRFVRKFFCLFSHILPGVCMLLIMVARCNAPFAVALITLSMGFNGASTLTNLQNCQDLAPNFAGTLYGMINVFGTASGPIIPLMVSAITAEKSDIPEWNLIFIISASVYIGCALIYLVIGSAKVQSFNNVDDQPPPAAEQA